MGPGWAAACTARIVDKTGNDLVANTRAQIDLSFQDAIDRWLESADFDSDGRISMEEFKLSIAGNTLVDELD